MFWAPVLNYRNYFINKTGQVLKEGASRCVASYLGEGGYVYVKIATNKSYRRKSGRWDKVRLCRGLATLVLSSHYRPRKKTEMIQFIDGNKKNCELDNLKWVDRSKRMIERFKKCEHC